LCSFRIHKLCNIQWNTSKPDPQETGPPWISADFLSPCWTILSKGSLTKPTISLNQSYVLVPLLPSLEKFHCIRSIRRLYTHLKPVFLNLKAIAATNATITMRVPTLNPTAVCNSSKQNIVRCIFKSHKPPSCPKFNIKAQLRND
jgi:hypothetical protein